MKKLILLIGGVFLLANCGSLILNKQDSSGKKAIKLFSRTLMGVGTLGYSELFIDVEKSNKAWEDYSKEVNRKLNDPKISSIEKQKILIEYENALQRRAAYINYMANTVRNAGQSMGQSLNDQYNQQQYNNQLQQLEDEIQQLKNEIHQLKY